MDFKKYLDKTAGELDREVERILRGWLKEATGISPKLTPLAKAFIEACKGGKRIRGTLVKLGYELGKGKSEEIIKIGAAYEILHTAILIHDDIMDQSESRRDKPSLYKSVGESHAITLGDLGFFLAIKIISESKFPETQKNNALNLLAKTLMDTAVGQLMDLEKLDPVVTAKLKTAQYTISGPLKLGAVLAGAKPDLIDKLDQFGENLGIAFQLQDDILDGQAGSGAKEKARGYAAKAKKMISKITEDVKMRQLLDSMAEFVVNRTK